MLSKEFPLMKKVKLIFLLVCASLFLSSLCWAADPPRSPGSPLPSGLTSPFPPSGTLSNGLKVDSNGYLLINAGGASGTSLTNGLKIDSSGNLLVDCATGCSTASGTITGVTAGTGLTGGGTSGSVTLNVAAATSSTLGGVEPDGDSGWPKHGKTLQHGDVFRRHPAD